MTYEQFTYFVDRFRFYIDLYDLGDWEIEIKKGKVGKGVVSTVYRDLDAKQATVVIGKNIGKCSNEELERTAFEEATHVLLGALSHLAESVYKTQFEIEREEHTVIRKLWKALGNRNVYVEDYER